MKRAWPLVIAAALSAGGALSFEVPAAPVQDEGAIVETIRALYAALSTDDAPGFRSATSPDFYAFDGGKRFVGEELLQLIRSAHASGKTYVWKVTQPEVHVDGETAWVSYVNRGSLRDGSGVKELTWLESVVLHKSDGAWRIQFLHSTRVPVE